MCWGLQVHLLAWAMTLLATSAGGLLLYTQAWNRVAEPDVTGGLVKTSATADGLPASCIDMLSRYRVETFEGLDLMGRDLF